MYSTEVLSELRSLNCLTHEAESLPEASAERRLLESQATTVQSRIPVPLLNQHKGMRRLGRPSMAPLKGMSCSICHIKLPSGTLGELKLAGRFAECPNCGVYVWSNDSVSKTHS